MPVALSGAERHHQRRDWLAELIAIPARDDTAFEAGRSFLPALPPDRVHALLSARAERDSANREGFRGLLDSTQVPRLFWVEEEYRDAWRMVIRRSQRDPAW